MFRDQEQLLQALIQRQLISSADADAIRSTAASSGRQPEEVLLADGHATEESLVQVKSGILGLPVAELTGKQIPRAVLELIPEEVAQNYQMVAFESNETEKELHVAMVNPQDFKALEAVEFLVQKSNFKVRYYVIGQEQFNGVFRQYRQLGDEAEEALSRISDEASLEQAAEPATGEQLQEVIKSAPVSKMVLVIMRHAVEGRASDIHIEPSLKDTRVRYRIDGVLRTSLVLPRYIHSAIVARIKVLANLRLDEARIPQDGRIRVNLEGHDIDFRVSTLPVAEGEKVVMRVLDTAAEVPSFEQLGFHPLHIEQIREGMLRPHGLSLLTGPTGSGKTTTLYTVLTLLNKDGVNIITLEDPIEYYIAGVNQSQINPEIGHTFAAGLRSILRQDPNIIMLGEIRDVETTELVVHASLTGHLVFSTLHTNDAVGTFGRLVDLGAEPFLIASVLQVIIAQRLARKICPDCKEPEKVPERMQTWIHDQLKAIPKKFLDGVDTEKIELQRGKGCSHCANLGYKGRMAVAEVITTTPALRELITQRAPVATIMKELAEQDFITLTQDCLIKALKGYTTLEEVLRVSQV